MDIRIPYSDEYAVGQIIFRNCQNQQSSRKPRAEQQAATLASSRLIFSSSSFYFFPKCFLFSNISVFSTTSCGSYYIILTYTRYYALFQFYLVSTYIIIYKSTNVMLNSRLSIFAVRYNRRTSRWNADSHLRYLHYIVFHYSFSEHKNDRSTSMKMLFLE